MTREATADGRDLRIAGIVLAAGRSSRMAPLNKLLLDAGGEPVVRRVAAAALAAQLAPVVVVTGHAREAVTRALRGLQVEFAHNAESAEGIASSLRAGVRALPLDVDAAVVLLGDMPLVEARHLRALLAAFAPERGGSLCVPTWQGTRGNPVLWGAVHFPELLQLAGDRGARGLFEGHAQRLREVAMPDDAVLLDIDSAEAHDQLSRRWRRRDPPVPAAEPNSDSVASLYGEAIFKLARRRGVRRLADSVGAFGATLSNRLCGARVRVEIDSDGYASRADAFEARGCLLCEAAAAALDEALPGKSCEQLGHAESYLRGLARGAAAEPPQAWSVLRVFAPLREHPGRLGCVLLPLEAVRQAFATNTSHARGSHDLHDQSQRRHG